jgi:hypothetical protein
MGARILKGKKRKGDSASFVDANGVESNSELHEQMIAGVDDTELRRETADMAVADGLMSKELAYRAFWLSE